LSTRLTNMGYSQTLSAPEICTYTRDLVSEG
jgi:hypothetical protein